eukprot:3383345-Amphidinium_carterae.1
MLPLAVPCIGESDSMCGLVCNMCDLPPEICEWIPSLSSWMRTMYVFFMPTYEAYSCSSSFGTNPDSAFAVTQADSDAVYGQYCSYWYYGYYGTCSSYTCSSCHSASTWWPSPGAILGVLSTWTVGLCVLGRVIIRIHFGHFACVTRFTQRCMRTLGGDTRRLVLVARFAVSEFLQVASHYCCCACARRRLRRASMYARPYAVSTLDDGETV